jgi:uncharacterized membrane protein YdjX (TVP38/TMEM64 family)
MRSAPAGAPRGGESRKRGGIDEHAGGADRILALTRTALARGLLGALFIAAIVAFVALGGPHYLSLDALKDNRDALLRFADAHQATALAIAFGVYAGTVALSLPGGLVLSLACGLLFGRVLGTAVAVVAATLGATLVFLAARYLFADLLRRRLGAAGARINAGFTRHALSYLLFLRLVPAFPFFLVNLAPAFTAIPVRTYVLGTLLGIIPGTFVYVNLGAALGRLDSLAGAVSMNTLGALGLLSLLALVPVFVRRHRAQPTPGA